MYDDYGVFFLSNTLNILSEKFVQLQFNTDFVLTHTSTFLHQFMSIGIGAIPQILAFDKSGYMLRRYIYLCI